MAVKRLGKFKFKDYRRKIDKSKARVIPRLLANEAKNHFLKGFRRGANRGGGFTDASRGGWEQRKTFLKGKGSGHRKSKGKGILIQSGTLRRSIKVIEAKFRRIIIGTKDIPVKGKGDVSTGDYAKRHNEGLAGMPKREFVGKSRVLQKRLRVILIRELDKAFK